MRVIRTARWRRRDLRMRPASRQQRATLRAAAATARHLDRKLGFDRESGLDREAGLAEALFEDGYPVMAPEGLAFEDEERYAEDVIGFRLLLRATVGEGALALEIFAILFGRETQIRDQHGDRIRLVGFELAAEEKFVRLAAVIEQPAVSVGEEPANQRGCAHRLASRYEYRALYSEYTLRSPLPLMRS